MERRTLEAVIYEREPPIARIILNRADKANTKDATLVQEVDACLHEADRDREIKVVILKANGKGFCGGHVARWGPDENPYPDFGDTFEDLYKGTADLFLWPTLYLWEFPKPTISQIHGYCMGGGIYLGLLTDFCVASQDAYFPDAARAESGRTRWAHHDRAVAADELASHDGLAAAGADPVGGRGAGVGAAEQGGAPRRARRHRRGDGAQDRASPADHVDGGQEQRQTRLRTDGHAGASTGQPHPDQHGRCRVRRSGTSSPAHAIRFEAKGFRRPRRTSRPRPRPSCSWTPARTCRGCTQPAAD